MQKQVLQLLLCALTIGSPNLAWGQGETFYCGRTTGVPTTMARTPQGGIPIIRWVSTLGDYEPEERCKIVSQKFQEFYDQGLLNFITTGRMNGQLVICVAARRGGGCKKQLYTLKPTSDPNETLQRLFNANQKASGPLTESSCRLYINMGTFLTTPDRAEAECPEPSDSDPETPPLSLL